MPVVLCPSRCLPAALLCFGGAAAASVPADRPAGELEEIVVTASFRRETLSSIPVSVTVLPAAELEQASLQHFADVLGLVPNLNWSGGTSRPR